MAEAVMRLFPGAKLGIGPAITDGFYYDFLLERALTPDDLAAIEAEMAKSIAANHTFTLAEHTFDDERAALVRADQLFKIEIMDDLAKAAAAEGKPAPNVTTYQHGEFQDLCRGPHVESTAKIGPFKLLSIAGAYWRGKNDRPMLQRIYGTAWPSQDELNAYLELLAEAEKRDHRRLGQELDLFSFPEEIGSGLAVFHPKGGIVRRAMASPGPALHRQAGSRPFQELLFGTPRQEHPPWSRADRSFAAFRDRVGRGSRHHRLHRGRLHLAEPAARQTIRSPDRNGKRPTRRGSHKQPRTEDQE